VLLSAVAYELVQEAFETSAGEGAIAIGLLAGSSVFFAAEVLIDDWATGERTRHRRRQPPGQRKPGGRSSSGSFSTGSRSRSSSA
jgi:hypothetical protein